MNDDGIIRRWPWLLVAGIVVFLLLSIRSVHQLKSAPTAEFFSVQSPAEKPDREVWARTYWECARGTIQWKYNYGEKLPSEPPPEFTPAKEPLRSMEVPEIRRRYWAQLQKDWLDSDNWDVSYSIDFSWVPALINRAADRLRDKVLDGIKAVRG